jgi:transcriptional regulator with XRE-family HTH domain
VSCSRFWMELNGATYGSIPQQSATMSFRTSLQNILDAEANYPCSPALQSRSFRRRNWYQAKILRDTSGWAKLCMEELRMVIGEKLKTLRAQKNLSQGDIEKRTGLLRCYISRVENGHTVPAIETLEKMARAMEVPLYQIFYDGEKSPKPMLPKPAGDTGWGDSGRDARTLDRFRRLMSRADEADRSLLLFMAQRMTQRKRRPIGRKTRGVLCLANSRGRLKTFGRGFFSPACFQSPVACCPQSVSVRLTKSLRLAYSFLTPPRYH